MNADLAGALEQLEMSWKAFEHNGKPMTKEQVRKALVYGLQKGYKHTGELTDADVDTAIGLKCQHDFTYFKHKPGVCSKCGETTEPIEEFEPDESAEEIECELCGFIDDHAIECPHNHSPFANLIRDGYD
mgnify:CR=1 FL=1